MINLKKRDLDGVKRDQEMKILKLRRYKVTILLILILDFGFVPFLKCDPIIIPLFKNTPYLPISY